MVKREIVKRLFFATTKTFPALKFPIVPCRLLFLFGGQAGFVFGRYYYDGVKCYFAIVFAQRGKLLPWRLILSPRSTS